MNPKITGFLRKFNITLDQNPAIARTAAHFTVIAGFLNEGYVSINKMDLFPGEGLCSSKKMETYPSY